MLGPSGNSTWPSLPKALESVDSQIAASSRPTISVSSSLTSDMTNLRLMSKRAVRPLSVQTVASSWSAWNTLPTSPSPGELGCCRLPSLEPITMAVSARGNTSGEKGPTMTRQPAEPLKLDYLIRAGAIHSMTGEKFRSVGLRGPEIVAVSHEADGLDDLAGAATVVVDAGDLTVLPAFADSHEHLIEASRNTLLVPVDKASSVAELTGMIADAARAAVPGSWILTSIGWHESNLAENRVPTLAEMDAAAPDNPVLARRGGHFAVVNSAGLRAAGINADTPDSPGGKIGRLADGSRSGELEGGAVYQVAAFAPGPSRSELAAAIGTASASYAALGVGTIREAMATIDDMLAYQTAWEEGLLSVRARLMMRVGSEQTPDKNIELIDGLAARS